MDQGWAFKSPTEILVDQMQTLVEVCLTVTGWRGSKSLGEPERGDFFWDKKSAKLHFDSQNMSEESDSLLPHSHDSVMTVSCREFHGVWSLKSPLVSCTGLSLRPGCGVRSRQRTSQEVGRAWVLGQGGPTQTAQLWVTETVGPMGPMVTAECQQKLSETDRSRKWCKCPNMISCFLEISR